MKTVSKILFPIDFSASAQKLVPAVKTMAEKFDADVHLLFVARVLQYFTSIHVPHPSVDQFEQKVIEGAQKKLAEFKEENFGGWTKLIATVRSGDISEEILNYISDNGIDLLIIGTHGRKGLDRIVFGSVAERVMKGAAVPVLLINPHRIGPEAAG
jgi:nucleotide-binding universal stress UspA family protein